MSTPTPDSWLSDPALWIVTSLTAGSSHIVTATSRLETILRANRVPFKAVDIAIEDKARVLWGRRAGKDPSGRLRKLPGLVQDGMVLGDLVEIEEWNEYGELKQHVKIYYDEHTIPPISQAPKQVEPPKAPNPPPVAPEPAPPGAAAAAAAAALSKAPKTAETSDSSPAPQQQLPVRTLADEAAAKAKQLRLQSLRNKVHGKPKPETEEKKDDVTEEKVEEKQEDVGGQKKEEEKEEDAAPAEAPAAASSEPDAATHDQAHHSVQSPNSTAWKPTGVFDPPSTPYHGAPLADVPADVIEAVERSQMIIEESKEEAEERSTVDEWAEAEKALEAALEATPGAVPEATAPEAGPPPPAEAAAPELSNSEPESESESESDADPGDAAEPADEKEETKAEPKNPEDPNDTNEAAPMTTTENGKETTMPSTTPAKTPLAKKKDDKAKTPSKIPSRIPSRIPSKSTSTGTSAGASTSRTGRDGKDKKPEPSTKENRGAKKPETRDKMTTTTPKKTPATAAGKTTTAERKGAASSSSAKDKAK